MVKFLSSVFRDVPFDRVQWPAFFFLLGTVVLSLTAVPLYIIYFGLPWYTIVLFVVFFCLTGMSITFGYHRLFAHKSFETVTPLRLMCLLFGAAAFENSAIDWVSDHRRHHKHTDEEQDPYDISKGLFYAHIGWILFKLRPLPPYDNVADLHKDPLARWQHRNWLTIAMMVGFVLPTLIGAALGGWVGALGGFLFGGVLRTVCVQHCTFCINSLCHAFGNRPYSKSCSARDSWFMALFTFGEGYHNYHHEFQHDYRNGIRPWHWDPTKWAIWTFSKLGLTWKLRTVDEEKILEAKRRTAELDHSPSSH
ncbi:MAG: acyl-CoA desaturase [Candidatus Methylacidiphilales bacterium]